MKYQVYTVLFLTFFIPKLFAQQQEPTQFLKNLSLDDAVEFALQNAPNLNIQRLKEQQQQEKLAQTRLDMLPDIYATSDLRRNLIIPITPIPAQMIDPSASDDELMYMRFNTPWSSAAGINLTYELFNPNNFGKKSEQEKELRITEIETEIAESDLRSEVAQAYIDCIIADSQLRSLLSDTLYYVQLKVEAAQQFQLGKISKAAKNRTEIDCNNAIARYLQAEHILHDSKIELLNKMGMEVDNIAFNQLSFSEDIETLYNRWILNHSFSESPSLTKAKLLEQWSLSQLKTRNMKLSYLPSLSLSGFYGANYFDRTFRFNHSDRWFGNSFVALSLRIPIMQSFSTAKAVSQLRFQEMIDQENLRAFQNRRSGDLSRELAQFDHLVQDYHLKTDSRKLWNENLLARSAEKDKGYILESEFQNEKLQAQHAFQEYLQAAYELLSAYIRIERLMKE